MLKHSKNLVSYKIPESGAPAVSAADNSLFEVAIAPDKDGKFYLHVLIGAGTSCTEVANSPFPIEITKSDIHKQLDEEKQSM